MKYNLLLWTQSTTYQKCFWYRFWFGALQVPKSYALYLHGHASWYLHDIHFQDFVLKTSQLDWFDVSLSNLLQFQAANVIDPLLLLLVTANEHYWACNDCIQTSQVMKETLYMEVAPPQEGTMSYIIHIQHSSLGNIPSLKSYSQFMCLCKQKNIEALPKTNFLAAFQLLPAFYNSAFILSRGVQAIFLHSHCVVVSQTCDYALQSCICSLACLRLIGI